MFKFNFVLRNRISISDLFLLNNLIYYDFNVNIGFFFYDNTSVLYFLLFNIVHILFINTLYLYIYTWLALGYVKFLFCNITSDN